MSRNEGFTLIELIVTIFIIAVALLGAVAASLKTSALVQETKRVAAADEYIAGEMDNIRSSGIDTADGEITVSISSPSVSGTYTLTSFEIVNVASSWTSNVLSNETTRAITFYVYRKGISWRP